VANKIVVCKSFTLRALRQRPNAGTYIDFVGYDEQGGKGKQIAVLQTNGPHDQEVLVQSLFNAIYQTWPTGDISFEVDMQGAITRVA
jgi:hypothetical protein